jgi:two-component system response regulator AlgR
MPIPLRVILADDETLARERLKALLADLSNEYAIEVVAEAATGEAALAKATTVPADVILLDIQMPGISGLETARYISLIPDGPAIIFVTAHDEHALRAFDLRAVDYLLKPVRLNRLKEALSRVEVLSSATPTQATSGNLADSALRDQTVKRTHFISQEGSRVWQVHIQDVLYLRAELRYVTARTHEREYLLDESLVKLESELSDSFLRIHRNCLVARQHLLGFKRVHDAEGGHWCAMLRGCEDRLPVSRRQAHIVKSFTQSQAL